MKHKREVIRKTRSVCPVCLKTINGEIIKEEMVYLEKSCEEHGSFKTLLWKGEGYEDWGKKNAPSLEREDHCPNTCGLCENHEQKTCCVLIEVTSRCNLECPICFANAKNKGEDLSLNQIEEMFVSLMKTGGPYNIQLSGGEPTLRDDLPEIIRIGVKTGFEFFQLNTNGLRIGNDFEYLKSLKEAGLGCVFLQFDGITPASTLKLRGKNILRQKKNAIENCKKLDLGVVLVPTLVPEVNTNEIGLIIQFALKSMPTVRGVHFQPISYFGRYQEKRDPLTLPEILLSIEKQTKGLMRQQDFTGGGAENAYCSFHGNFLLNSEGQLKSLNSKQSCCSSNERSRKSAEFVAKHWSTPRIKKVGTEVEGLNTDRFKAYLDRLETHKIVISGMLFQDAWSLDLKRLKKCYIHVLEKNGDLIPFCAYNLTGTSEDALYRGKYD